MARSLPSLPMQKLSFLPIPINFFFIFIAIFSVFSIVTFLCASHKAKKLQSHKKVNSAQFGEKKLSKLQSNISSKALLMVKMISWRKNDEGEEDFDNTGEDEAVWKRSIIMGERCRPLDFSGKIVYDSQGNLLPN